ncbi:MAG: hypothetical protein K9L56_13240 [Clostridiales bacterium]|nr:hypothetical protein [Clostridiales bacterium]
MANQLGLPSEMTQEEILKTQKRIANAQEIIAGSKTIKEYGLKWNQTNDTYERLGDAVGLSVNNTSNPHISDFDNHYPWSDARLVNLLDDINISAIYPSPTFKWDGSNGQVMLEVPKFYIKTMFYENATGDMIWEWWISNTKLEGYELHPAFIDGGQELDACYIGAKEATLWDDSASAYSGDGVTYDYSNDKLASISGFQPLSGNTSHFDIVEARQLAENRGKGWHQYDIRDDSLLRYLVYIEYGTLRTQQALSEGITNLDSATGNHSQNTGHTDSLGDASGEVIISALENGATGAVETYAFQYRGIENPFGNIWKFVDGILLKDDGYYIGSDIENYNEIGNGYDFVGKDLTIGYGDGYIDNFEFLPNMKYLFFANSTSGSSTTKVADFFYEHDIGEINIVQSGGRWFSGSIAGLAFLYCCYDASSSYRTIGARLCARKI